MINLVKNSIFTRYIFAGVWNTIFHYSLICCFLYMGASAYEAQFFALWGSLFFNFFSYKKIAFSSEKKSYFGFLANHFTMYFISVLLLSIVQIFEDNSYVSTGLVTLLVTCVNFFVLKKYIF
jgi:putative flippase GtrA